MLISDRNGHDSNIILYERGGCCVDEDNYCQRQRHGSFQVEHFAVICEKSDSEHFKNLVTSR